MKISKENFTAACKTLLSMGQTHKEIGVLALELLQIGRRISDDTTSGIASALPEETSITSQCNFALLVLELTTPGKGGARKTFRRETQALLLQELSQLVHQTP